MSISEKDLRVLLSQLVISLPVENFEGEGLSDDFKEPVRLLLQGQYPEVLKRYSDLLFSPKAKDSLHVYPKNDLLAVLKDYVNVIDENFTEKCHSEELANFHLHLVAIAFLQTFIQINFTGPALEHNSSEEFFPGVDVKMIQLESIQILNISGQQTYELMEGAIYFIVAELIFERLTKVTSSILDSELKTDELIDYYSNNNNCSAETSNSAALKASVQWWMARALQVHISLLFEPASILSSVSSLLLNPSVSNCLSPAIDGNAELQRTVQMIYYLECARTGIHNQTEHLSIPLLGKARKLSNFQFILSGAKAKRTKFQKYHTSALIVLAKSQESKLFSVTRTEEDGKENPESFALDSDLLLEKPQYESLEDLEFKEEDSDKKRIKLDSFADDGSQSAASDSEEKLLPIAFRTENIPEELRSLDPNNQPGLSDLDNLQLLLRLTTLRQTSPSGNSMVDEELIALVSRALYTSSKQTNWSIFSRALWERSILETTKARTIERGILQMTSLVEEMGIKIKTRIIPQAMEDESANNSTGSLPASFRLRFIHQLPLMPQWTMDAKLAEKYMSLGVLRSAVEIYLRLNMVCEAALCYAAVGEEGEAEKLILERLEVNPKDARAISILGDIRQDPSMWEKAWEVGKYYKAQGSLSHYYYNPPRDSGLKPNIELAIKHMNVCLTANPLNYENWFFYGCCGLESQQYNLASEAFTRCVSLDETNSHAWSNLASALLRTDKTRPAFNALKKAIRCQGDSKQSWRIYENYLIVAAKLNEWSDVLIACRELINIKRDNSGEGSIDIPVVEKLVDILVATEYPTGDDQTLTYYQSSCIDFVCVLLPNVITTSARCWRIVAKVELWRKRPWVALECHEKAFRAVTHRPELEIDEVAWNEAVEACSDLIAAYESLGELPGKHGAGDVVCKDWKYKSRSTVRSLLSKGKAMWEDSEGWERLQEMKEEFKN
ncbi:essential for maintenance of the cell wall protein 1 [[Candida] railenensis]|uniref:Essential for maintenance of the cell wall protein 1 n=1 Tax=[Candida] railenensis TaxID=45579 RepID=A0A9P0QQC6_9ASCO|nr:essential for maintenance of the cell wall protein 1 [[Candida] railenensis]